MADKKISELTPASTLADADVFVATQGAETKKVPASVVKTYVTPVITTVDNTTVTDADFVMLNNNRRISIANLKLVLGI